jgi:Flp pilus assembly protein CpaB
MVLLGIAFFAVGAILVFLVTRDDDADPVGAPEVQVVVAIEAIAVGELGSEVVEAGKVRQVAVPADRAVPGAISSPAQLEGVTFIQAYGADQQITSAGIRGRARAFEIPAGHEAVAVEIASVAAGSGYVREGDRINLYGVFSNQPPGDRPAPRAHLLLRNVEVLDVSVDAPARRGAVTGGTEDPNQPAARQVGESIVFLLALTPGDVEKLVFATKFEGLYATLLPADAPPVGPTPGRDAGNVLE